jgi:hypothetical protein
VTGRGTDEPELGAALGQPSLAAGFLACAPLFVLYEVGLLMGGAGSGRSSAQIALGLVLEPLGSAATWVRWILIIGLTVGARSVLRRRGIAPARAVARNIGEGLLCALALGPVLIALSYFFDAALIWDLPARPVGPVGSGGAGAQGPGFDLACRLVGAAVWEELLFRVGFYGLFFLFAARVSGFLGLSRSIALLVGDLVALLGSSVIFAAFHLALFQRWLGYGGEPFDGAVFLWRLLAGLLLAGLFRWRGLGVCAWSHGLFNLALALGAGPAVFQ